ncbi:hypothetical protein PpBr36_07926 [Pyricularia pennisetigena]|uniref:hypothetical protein n=1 Tax=Pyricularia pennisetigena TaxID=1578925 RepID=UPI0011544642|nr:hypothetical protein PpBr36_07926 [Pyricularia pennisetigena]TLS25756.1 hypothetical protein PpBr36_07926 [Pyricularia pennisetigena]
MPLSAQTHTYNVKSLWLALLLGAQNPLPGSTEVGHLDTHSPLTKRHQPSLRADCLDVGTRQVILLRNELFQIDVLVERHLGGVEGEDLALGVLIRILEQDLSVDTAGSDQGRVKRLNLVGGHNDLYVTTVVETVELVEQLQHGTLDLALASGC